VIDLETRRTFQVSILTRPEGRVQPAATLGSAPAAHCFNPHPSRRTGATQIVYPAIIPWRVSILTRPEGRVQHNFFVKQFVRWRVSILTRPEGRVQHLLAVRAFFQSMFQSSPVPKDGCNPSRATGATVFECVSILTRPEGRVQRRTTALNSTLWSNFSALSPC